MATHQSKKITDTERRLQSLKTQLYGKERTTIFQPKNSITASFRSPLETKVEKGVADTNYLQKDLLKITTLAILAIAVQLLLYLAIRQGLLKI